LILRDEKNEIDQKNSIWQGRLCDYSYSSAAAGFNRRDTKI
jgi:hypothetical protein